MKPVLAEFIESNGHGAQSTPRYWIIAPFESNPVDMFDKVWQFDLANHPQWSGQKRPTDVARDLILLAYLLLIRQACFRSPAPWSAFQDVTVV